MSLINQILKSVKQRTLKKQCKIKSSTQQNFRGEDTQ